MLWAIEAAWWTMAAAPLSGSKRDQVWGRFRTAAWMATSLHAPWQVSTFTFLVLGPDPGRSNLRRIVAHLDPNGSKWLRYIWHSLTHDDSAWICFHLFSYFCPARIQIFVLSEADLQFWSAGSSTACVASTRTRPSPGASIEKLPAFQCTWLGSFSFLA